MKPAFVNAARIKSRLLLTGLLAAAVLCLPVAGRADTQTTHRVHKVKKQQPPPPLPSGTQGPVPQVPLDAIPAVAPQVNYQDGLLTIVAPNSTLGDILRSVRKHTSAEIDVPANASERVVTRLGPGPVRDVMAELLNGSHFNYILLGSPDNANSLVRVVLVAKTGPDNPPPANEAGNPAQPAEVAAETPEPETQDDNSDDNQDQTAAEAEQQQQPPPDQPGVRTPQQMLQEMQQRQLQIQQQQQPGQPPTPYPGRPGIPVPQPPQQQQ
jgi:hypothetical protein